MKKLNQYLFKKAIIIPILIFLTFILFHKVFEGIINDTVVKFLFSFCKSSWYNDIVIGCILLIIVLYYIPKFKNKYIISFNFLFPLLLFNIGYLIYRLNDKVWNFTPFYFDENVKYLDLILAFSFIAIFVYVINRIKPKPLQESITSPFLEDNPIGKDGIDLLSYSGYAKKIVEKIEVSQFKKSFAIGITGEWGSGKTSFIDLLKKEFDSKNTIFIDFNPWNSQSSEAIIQDFFNAFQNEIENYHSTLPKLLSQYSENLTKITGDHFSKILNSYLKNFNNEKSTIQQLKEINILLEKINKKIIVFIDDLDRLDKEELIEVMRLIRNTGNFNNTFFIVAYDRNYLVRAIKGLNTYNSEFFLEKIFQFEVILPHFESKVIRNKINELLKQSLGEQLHIKIDEATMGIRRISNINVEEYISNIRDVVRFCNALTLHYQMLNVEIVFSELFQLELIRLKYPSVYQLLYKMKDEFIETKLVNRTNHCLVLKKAKQENVTKYTYVIEDHLNTNYEDLSLPKSHIPKIVYLISKLFPDSHYYSYKNHLSIIHPSKYYRYFSLRLLEGNLSEAEFNFYRKKNQSEFNEKIKEWASKKLHFEVRDRFESVKEYESKEDFEKVIRAIFFLAVQPTYSNYWYDKLAGYSTEDFFNKFYNKKQLINNYYNGNEEELKQFILSLFNKAESPYTFESTLIYEAISMFQIGEFIVEKNIFEEKVVDYLEKYLNSITKLDGNVIYLFRNCNTTNWIASGSNTYTSEKVQLPKSISLLKKFVSDKDLYGFLKATIGYNFRDDEHPSKHISELAREVFNNHVEFGDFINQFDENKFDFLSEYKVFYKECEKVNFEKYVPFAFTHFPNNKE